MKCVAIMWCDIDSYCICEKLQKLKEICFNVILFDKDKWSAAIACVNKYKPSIQNTVISYVCDKDI